MQRFFAHRSAPLPMTVYHHVSRESEPDFRMLYSEWVAFGLMRGHQLADFQTFRDMAAELLGQIENDQP
jgi:hypothetical protein